MSYLNFILYKCLHLDIFIKISKMKLYVLILVISIEETYSQGEWIKSEHIKFLFQTSNFDVALLQIYLDPKFQWQQKGLNCESVAYEVVT